ncbi:hypothetical protein CL619_02015 [archaeon]|nr:hypothetical protein [archaeon]
MTEKNNWIKNFRVWLVIMLFLNWPLVQAITFSDIQSNNITDQGAVISWKTNETADSYVHYGTNVSQLSIISDLTKVENHSVSLSGLLNSTKYYYEVKSKSENDNNSGKFYGFTTLAKTLVDKSSAVLPKITVSLPTTVAKEMINISGTTDTGVQVKLKVNGLTTSTQAVVNKSFLFTKVSLKSDAVNRIELEVKNKAGQIGSKKLTVYADLKKPQITLKPVLARVNGTSVKLEGTINKKTAFEIFVNNRSAYKAQTNNFSKSITLKEGKNDLELIATDVGGKKNTLSLQVTADTKVPSIQATVIGGLTYYEGRAKSDIAGETKAGAKVYLYVFPREVYSRAPDFSKAREVVTADGKGKFTFSDVNFEGIHIALKDLKPRQIPTSLKDVVLPAADVIRGQTQKSYEIYLLAEDQLGRVSTLAWKKVVLIYNCFSADYAFTIDPMIEYQLPYRLKPTLLDEGRQTISSTIKLKYTGTGVAPKEGEKGFRVQSMRVDRACTSGMMEKGAFNISCKIFPRNIVPVSSPDKTAYFLQATLGRTSELTKKDSNLWQDFQKRQLTFPLKVTLAFQERNSQGGWSDTKTQTSCINLGYFVDIPLESKDLMPGPLVDGLVDALNETTEAIDTILPFIEKAMLVVGIGCGISMALRLVTQIYRKFISKLEPFLDKAKEEGDKDKCVDPQKLYLKSTMDSFDKVKGTGTNLPKNYLDNKREDLDLEQKCSMTAGAWKAESVLNTALRWSCDRFFCHKAPAKWTEDAEQNKVMQAKLAEQACGAFTGMGVPLRELKNCQGYIDKNPQKFTMKIDNPVFKKTLQEIGQNTCYVDGKENIYYIKMNSAEKKDAFLNTRIWKLSRIGNTAGGTIGNNDFTSDNLLAYQPKGAKNYIVSRDITCTALCQQRKGYTKDNCYPIDMKTEEPKKKITGNRYVADYTTDCFPQAAGTAGAKAVAGKASSLFPIQFEGDKKTEPNIFPVKFTGETTTISTGSANELRICVCKGEERKKGEKETPVKQEWSYRQAQLFRETGGNPSTCNGGSAGVCYPDWRYYKGRDLSAAFGLDHVLDMTKTKKTIAEINPFTSHLAAFQTLCLSGIYNRLRMLNSVLKGVRNCLIEAKYTGIKNAGTCKELFSQAVCGLLYKLFAYASKGCSPLPFLDIGRGDNQTAVEAGVGFGLSAVKDALDTSMGDLSQEYGNAKLNEMFKAGTQGVIRNVCLAAFGYDWPYGLDFLTDAAYRTPMKTSALVVPAERELVSYDPIKSAPRYSYRIGASIFPGCKIRRYEVKLKCVTSADLGKENIDCATAGSCPCLGINQKYPEMEHSLFTSTTGVETGSYVSVPLKSPQIVPKPYVYDHVALEIELDRFEEPKNCFEASHIEGNKGVYYAPITDVSGKPLVSCQADSKTGRFSCPKLSNFFNTLGNTHLQSPYVECLNKYTGKWIKCDGDTSFNYLKKGDQITIRPHIHSDGKKQCLRIQLTGMATPMMIPIAAAAVPRTTTPEINLMTVTDTLLGGTSGGTKTSANGDCGTHRMDAIGGRIGYPSVKFDLKKEGIYYVLSVDNPSAITIYDKSKFNTDVKGRILKNGNYKLISNDLAEFKFDFNGQRITSPIKTTIDSGKNTNVCTYSTISTGQSISGNIKRLELKLELRHPIKDSCSGTTTALSPTFGKAGVSVGIRIQNTFQDIPGVAGTSSFYAIWKTGAYTTVISNANKVMAQSRINQKYGSQDVLALYYYVAANLMVGNKKEAGSSADLFFTTRQAKYNSQVKGTNEYLKIQKYLSLISEKYGSNKGTGIAGPISTPSAGPSLSNDHKKCTDKHSGWSCACTLAECNSKEPGGCEKGLCTAPGVKLKYCCKT